MQLTRFFVPSVKYPSLLTYCDESYKGNLPRGLIDRYGISRIYLEWKKRYSREGSKTLRYTEL